MRPILDLRLLQRSGLRRLSRLRVLASAATLPRALPHERETRITYCVLELHSFWFSFSRALFLSAAFGARDAAGSRVALSKVARPANIGDAMTHAIRRLKPHLLKDGRTPPWSWYEEPKWSEPTALLASLDEIGASNRPRVVAGLSVPTRVFDDLPEFRNFYAHKTEDTARRVPPIAAVYAIPPKLPPSQMLLSLASGRPQPLLLDWIDDVANAVTFVI